MGLPVACAWRLFQVGLDAGTGWLLAAATGATLLSRALYRGKAGPGASTPPFSGPGEGRAAGWPDPPKGLTRRCGDPDRFFGFAPQCLLAGGDGQFFGPTGAVTRDGESLAADFAFPRLPARFPKLVGTAPNQVPPAPYPGDARGVPGRPLAVINTQPGIMHPEFLHHLVAQEARDRSQAFFRPAVRSQRDELSPDAALAVLAVRYPDLPSANPLFGVIDPGQVKIFSEASCHRGQTGLDAALRPNFPLSPASIAGFTWGINIQLYNG